MNATDKYTVLATVLEAKKNLQTKQGTATLIKVLPHRKQMAPANIWINDPKNHPWDNATVGETVACAILGNDDLLGETSLAAIPMAAYEARNGGSQ